MNGQTQIPPEKPSVSSASSEKDSSLESRVGVRLNWIITGLLIIIAGLAIWVVYVSFIAKPPAPRTQEELNLAVARRAVKSNPSSVVAHNELGLAYVDIGAYGKAIDEFKTAAKLNSKAAEPHYHLAKVYLKQKKMDGAIKELKKILKIEPKTELAHFELGQINLKQKKYKDAIESFTKAVEIVPVGGDTHYYLGLAYEKDGQKENAIKEYQEALKFVPDYKEAQEALERIQKAVPGQ